MGTDAQQRMLIMLVGMPRNEDAWFDVLDDIIKNMNELEEQFKWTDANTLPDYSRGEGTNRRGDYRTLAGGISFGSGQKASSRARPDC